VRIWIAILAFLLPATAEAATCKDELAIWAAKQGGVRNIAYQAQTDGLRSMWPSMVLEEWRDGKLAWRAVASTTCSNGHSICYIFAPDNASLIGESTTEAIIERIDENRDGLADWMILAGLGEQIWYADGLRVDWFNGFGKDEQDERITLPNQYKFSGCQTELSTEDKAKLAAEIEIAQRPLFALPELCAQAKNGVRTEDFIPDGNDHGIWWTRGRRLVGWEYSCVIRSIKNGAADIHCDMGDLGVWDDNPGWTESDESLEISKGDAKTKLRLCR
jgi:hypothetical protein